MVSPQAVWHAGFNDATVAGWLITAGYFVAGSLCYLAMVTARPQGSFRRGKVFWFCLAVGMLVLGINKQLDLQTALADWGRQMARQQGWYSQRRTFQQKFIAALAVSAGLCLAWLAWRIRKNRWPCWLALAGIVLQVTFILIRAVSFHHVDHLLGVRWLAAKVHVWLEMAGIVVISSAAILSVRLTRSAKKRPNIPAGGRKQSG